MKKYRLYVIFGLIFSLLLTMEKELQTPGEYAVRFLWILGGYLSLAFLANLILLKMRDIRFTNRRNRQ